MHGLSPIPPRHHAPVYIDPDVPCYMVIMKQGFVDDMDRLWERGSRIYWDGQPSLALDPVNEAAEERMLEYLKKQDGQAQAVAAQKGMGHATLVNAFEARRRIREIQNRQTGDTPDSHEDMPILRAKKDPRKAMARSVDMGPPSVPMMGHQARYEVAPTQARMRAKKTSADSGGGEKQFGFPKIDTNAGRVSVNSDDKGVS